MYPPQDLREAEKWLKRGATNGSAKAMFLLGDLYFEHAIEHEDSGVLPDIDASIHWWSEAAEHGKPHAYERVAAARGITQVIDEMEQDASLSLPRRLHGTPRRAFLFRTIYRKMIKDGVITRLSQHESRRVKCGHCGRTRSDLEEGSRSLQKCERCRRVYYCSVECQHEHWRATHRRDCAAMATADA